MPKYEDTETSLPRRAHHSMPRQSMPTSKPNDMKQILILILCAFVLSCKSTKTVSSSYESERNAVSQAQWRSAQNLSFSSLQRLTALSFDSCVVVFGGADTSATPLYSSFSYPSGDPSASFKAKPSTSHGNATDFVRGEPCSASHPTYGKPSPSAQGASSPSVRGQPQTLKIYGLHLSHKEKEKSVAAQEQEDTFAQAKQSSFDKSNSSEKSKTSVPFTAKLCIALLVIIVAVAIIAYIRRRSSGKRIHFGRRHPQS